MDSYVQRSVVLGLTMAVVAGGCVPSQRALFDPVGDAVFQRTGLRPDWRAGWERTLAVDKRVKELLAKPLDVESVALLAVLNSPALQADYAELSVAGASVAAASTPSNPEVSAELLFPIDGGDHYVELSAVQNISQLISLLPRKREADAELRAARRRATVRTIALATRARVAFYEVAAAERVLELRRRIAEGALASADLARRLNAAGNLTNLDLARQEFFEEQADLDVVEAETEVTASRERLNTILGLTGDEAAWSVAKDSLKDPDGPPMVAHLEREAVEASLDLDAMRWEIEAAGQGIGAARVKSFVPDLGLGVAAKEEASGWGVGPVVSFSVPLWDWGRGERAAAWAKLRRAQQRYTALGVDVRAAARVMGARLLAAHTRAQRLETRLLPLRERMRAESVLAYNAMNVDVFQLLVERREAINTEVQYIDALRDYWIASAHVDELRAGSLPEGWSKDGSMDNSSEAPSASSEH